MFRFLSPSSVQRRHSTNTPVLVTHVTLLHAFTPMVQQEPPLVTPSRQGHVLGGAAGFSIPVQPVMYYKSVLHGGHAPQNAGAERRRRVAKTEGRLYIRGRLDSGRGVETDIKATTRRSPDDDSLP
ncbi:hypothetical protein E2C01_024416 [Portunus trituberculatus]|uniref:Uncharacterized protein n=1 Tax=Portunus trituberculatus TaxID=210409 RepID=A0A5B7ECR8_PORTR|nr:hypothetical protein [Portunus trituberculatus]